MAMFDYCQNELLNHSCRDYRNNNCDFCNVYRAYRKGIQTCAYEIEKQALHIGASASYLVDRKEQEQE